MGGEAAEEEELRAQVAPFALTASLACRPCWGGVRTLPHGCILLSRMYKLESKASARPASTAHLSLVVVK